MYIGSEKRLYSRCESLAIRRSESNKHQPCLSDVGMLIGKGESSGGLQLRPRASRVSIHGRGSTVP